MKSSSIYDILPFVKRPNQYLGNEINARRKPWDETALRVALIFPDLYEIGMSHLGLHILYHILNDIHWAMADRAYCPDKDMETLLREKGLPLFGVESRRPLKEFDILGITLAYELCYTNIITILELAGIPVMSQDRHDPAWPIVIGGGSSAANPEPVAGLFDAILIGDGEEAIVEIADTVRSWREAKGTKNEISKALSRIKGVYVPGLYRSIYEKNGDFKAIEPINADIPDRIYRRILPDLENAPFPDRPLVPYAQIVHDRLGIEIARGCTRGCRFCQAGISYRPVRERTPEKVMELFDKGLKATGWEEISLLSLSTGDYGCLTPLLTSLVDRYLDGRLSISLPSLRVGTLTQEIMAQIKRVRKTGFTLAPEAGSERLRRVINKGITEEALLETASSIYCMGWSGIKLYFMTGLPTETLEDVIAIDELARKVLARAKDRQNVTVSVGTFVPKPHTPFQWERQLTLDESWERIDLLKKKIRGHSLKLKWHDPRQSLLEGVFSRGDRRLISIILRAWRLGARLDAWGDRFRPDLYHQAAVEEGIPLAGYLGPIDTGRPLAWGHIETGVKAEFLLRERELAFKEAYTKDCRGSACQGCGVCDFKEIKPVSFKDCTLPPHKNGGTKEAEVSQQERFFYSLSFMKIRDARFTGQLEMAHSFHRAFRRAGFPVVYSGGHHPMPHISFGPPVPVGTEALGEPLVIGLTRPVSQEELLTALNQELPDGIRITFAERTASSRIPCHKKADYLIHVPGYRPESAQKTVGEFNAAVSWPITRWRKGKELTLDIKQAVESICLAASGETSGSQAADSWLDSIERDSEDQGLILRLTMLHDEGPRPKPAEAAGAILALDEDALAKLRILKLPSGGHP